MDWLDTGGNLEFWKLAIGPLIAALLAWLGKRKGLRVFKWLDQNGQTSLRRQIGSLQNQLETCEELRVTEREARKYAILAFKELMAATMATAETPLTNFSVTPVPPES